MVESDEDETMYGEDATRDGTTAQDQRELDV